MIEVSWNLRVLCPALAIVFGHSSAIAQTGPEFPYRVSVDKNGVNLATGQLVLNGPSLSIGDASGKHLDFNITIYGGQTFNNVTDNYNMFVIMSNKSFNPIPPNSVADVILGSNQESFTEDSSSQYFYSTNSNANNFWATYGEAVYTIKDGTYIQFYRPSWQSNGSTNYCNSQSANGAKNCYVYGAISGSGGYFDYLPVKMVKPDGEILYFTYENQYFAVGSNSTGGLGFHLLSVKSSSGFELRFNYINNFYTISSVYAINNTIETCGNDITSAMSVNLASSPDTCSGLNNKWPSMSLSTTIADGGTPYSLVITDANSEQYTYNFDANNDVTSTILPNKPKTSYSYVPSNNYAYNSMDYWLSSIDISPKSSGAPDIKYTYDFNYITVTSSPYFKLTYGNPVTAVIKNTNFTERTTVSDSYTGIVVSDKDAAGNTTVYTEDSLFGHIIDISYQDGHSVKYDYDSRGNLQKQTSIPISGSGLSNIVKTAGYDATCTNSVKCNEPNWTQDGLGNETDYTYDQATGLVTSVTGPADANGVHPQKRYTYQPRYAYYVQSGGNPPTQAATSISVLTGISTCRTEAGTKLVGAAGQGPFSLSTASNDAAACAGTSDETTATIDYGPQTAGTANNLFPVSQTVAAGDGSVSATTSQTYDNIGNVVTTVGPLDSGQTTAYYYDADRRAVGVVKPAASSGGVSAAIKYTYNADGALVETQVGTVPDQTANSWNNSFSEAYHTSITQDAFDRPTRTSVISNGTSYAVNDVLYDGLGRAYCSIQYMDLTAVPSSIPTSCVPAQTTGVYGADRVTQIGYDNDNRVTSMTKAVSTSTVSTETTAYATNSNLVSSVRDGMNNLTSYAYDGFDRLQKVNFPVTTQSGNTSDTGDYESYSYDADDNVSSKRLRDGSSIGFTYDNLGRVETRTPAAASGGALTYPYDYPVSYSYDLVNEVTQIARPGDGATLSYGYDALGRLTQEGQPFGTMTYQYDLAGDRTQIAWPDGFFVDYLYDMTGNVTKIEEKGVTSGVQLLASYKYDNLGRRTSVAYGNGTGRSYAYDAVNRLAGLQLTFPNSANNYLIGSLNGTGTIGYTPSSQIASIPRSNNAYIWSGDYNINRDYTTNGLNQYTKSGGVVLGYDVRGNLSSSGATTYGYSKLNELASVPAAGASIYYDPLSRITEYDTTVSTRFYYSGGTPVAEVANPSGAITQRYVPGAGTDEPIVWYVGADTSQRRFLQADERGSVVAVTDSSGNMIATNTYDAFGIPGSNNVGRFEYTGQTWFPEVGLYNYKARWYSPSLGRFMQTDPIGYGDGLNWYDYAHGDPINGSDPSGMDDNFDAITTENFGGFSLGGTSAVIESSSYVSNNEIQAYGYLGGYDNLSSYDSPPIALGAGAGPQGYLYDPLGQSGFGSTFMGGGSLTPNPATWSPSAWSPAASQNSALPAYCNSLTWKAGKLLGQVGSVGKMLGIAGITYGAAEAAGGALATAPVGGEGGLPGVATMGAGAALYGRSATLSVAGDLLMGAAGDRAALSRGGAGLTGMLLSGIMPTGLPESIGGVKDVATDSALDVIAPESPTC